MDINKIITCPNCKKKLDSALFCKICKTKFKVKRCIPILLPKLLDKAYVEEYNKKSVVKDMSKVLRFKQQKLFYSIIKEELTKVKKKDVVLDIGCGADRVLKDVNTNNKMGIDISFRQAENAKLHGMISIVGDAQHIPLRNDLIDYIICLEVIEHLKRPDLLISECSRVLKKGGTLILTTPNKYSIRRLIGQAFFGRHGNKLHLHIFSKKDLNKLLEGTDISIIKSIPNTVEWIWYERLHFGRFIERVDYPVRRLLSKMFLPISDKLILIIKKQKTVFQKTLKTDGLSQT